MTTTAHTDLTIEQISVGDTLPPLVHEATTTSIILGALASRDWRPMHHDRDFAQQRNGTRHIHEHAQPGRLAGALHHRLGRTPGAYRSLQVSYGRLNLPGRQDGLYRRGNGQRN
jgi:acyl dehydratase